MHKVALSLILIFFLGLMVHYVPDAEALSISDYHSCNQRYEHLKIVGTDTYVRMFSNSEAARFCMAMFEAGLLPKVIKDQYEISRLGVTIDLPNNWSGSEVTTDDMTIAFAIPDKRESDTMEPLWTMLLIVDKTKAEDVSNKVFKQVGESLNDVPHFMNTCQFNEPENIEIKQIEFLEQSVVCIDRRLALFVTITSYSFTAKDNEIYIVSAIRHLPSHPPTNEIIKHLETLEFKKILENIENIDTQKAEIQKEKFPNWFKKYVLLWGQGKITDRQIIDLFNYIVKNNILNVSYFPDYGFYNAAKVPNWFKHTAIWLGSGQISEDEFLTNFKYLVKNRIIVL